MVIGTGPGQYAIIINGRQVDVAYGDPITAQQVEAEWRTILAADVLVADELDTPFSELVEDDSYWLNGHIEPLRLDGGSCGDYIPFQGEPVEMPEKLGENGL
jgi:hypothetical protein